MPTRILAAALALALAGCGGSGSPAPVQDKPEAPETETVPDAVPGEDGNAREASEPSRRYEGSEYLEAAPRPRPATLRYGSPVTATLSTRWDSLVGYLEHDVFDRNRSYLRSIHTYCEPDCVEWSGASWQATGRAFYPDEFRVLARDVRSKDPYSSISYAVYYRTDFTDLNGNRFEWLGADAYALQHSGFMSTSAYYWYGNNGFFETSSGSAGDDTGHPPQLGRGVKALYAGKSTGHDLEGFAVEGRVAVSFYSTGNLLDASFDQFQRYEPNIAGYRDYDDFNFTSVRVDEQGYFTSDQRGNWLDGNFYGPNAEEVGGIAWSDELTLAFGAIAP